MVNTLIINTGSSNVKFALYKNNKLIAKETIEIKNSINNIGKEILNIVINKLKTNKSQSWVQIDRIAYRVVYSGKIKEHCIITVNVIKELRKIQEFAPNHMPNTVKLIEFFMKNTKSKHIACFDTGFHSKMPEIAKIYAIPMKLTKKYNIQRFGFHGLAHQMMSEKVNLPKVITCQLGNGVSISAVKNGKCIDTSMGFTPLEGVMMGTRSGNIDPYLVYYLAKKENKPVSKIIEILQKESGLKGIANESNMEKILKRKDKSAKLAIDMFCYSIKKQIGAYIAALGGVDAVVFGGGISHNRIIINKCIQKLNCKRIIVYDANEHELMLKISKKFK